MPNPVRFHTLKDLDATTHPNAVITKTANTLFAQMQQAGDIDNLPDDDQLEGPMQETYYRIFGFRPTAYHTPDKFIGLDKAEFIPEVHGWGRSENHGRIANQANLDQRAAIALYTGVSIPATPAQAAGGKADLGGYYPHQAPKGKGGRSAPYSSSSGSNWWYSSAWGSWSSWGWRS